MKIRYYAVILAAAAVINIAIAIRAVDVRAQQSQMKDDLAQLVVDLKVGMDRSSLTAQQKAQLRDDFKELRRARQNHEMFATLRAARSIRTALDSGAFKPEDKQRIKEDLQAIKEAREEGPRLGG